VTATDRDDSGTLRAITQEWLRAIAGIRTLSAMISANVTARASQTPVGQFALNKNGTQIRKVAEFRRYAF
jgi:hypothetical protein